MFIIIRRSTSTFSTSLTRTSSLSDRSLTVIPSARVMVRLIGGSATGGAAIGARGELSRRAPTGRPAGRKPPGRVPIGGRGGGMPGRCG